MKTRRCSLSPRAYTLIEMLVVIGIIAILASIAVPAAMGVIGHSKRVKTQAALKGLTLGLANYHTEYNRYPLPPGHTGEEPISLDAGSTVLKILLGENQQKMNPRESRYIEPTVGPGGLVGAGGSYALIDLWGTPYQVIMDANLDDKIANPDVKNTDPAISSAATPDLFFGVVALSHGADRKPNTKDDVVSWR